jgi:hypothetical protein
MPPQSLAQGHYLTVSRVRLKRNDVLENLLEGVPYGLEITEN